MDTLTITGVSPRFDGVYDCDIIGMIRDLGSAEALTGDEACYIQERSKVRGRELVDAFIAGDTRFLMALTAVVLQRHGKTIDIDVLMPKPLGSYVFELAEVEDEETPHPTVEGEPSPTTSRNGGTSSDTPSDSQDAALKVIGAHG